MPDSPSSQPVSPEPAVFRSGFVNIIGRPNAGKSTLMNALVGERMSIITHKPQTTRHRIIGILTGDHFQIVVGEFAPLGTHITLHLLPLTSDLIP